MLKVNLGIIMKQVQQIHFEICFRMTLKHVLKVLVLHSFFKIQEIFIHDYIHTAGK